VSTITQPPVVTDRPGRRDPRRAAGWGPVSVGPLLRRLHFYVGVFVAPFLVIAALSGLLYTFTPQLEQAAYGDQLRVAEVGAQRVPLSEQVAAAQAVVPHGTVVLIHVPDAADATTRVEFQVPELVAEEKERTVYVDPYTGRVQGVLTTWFSTTPLTTWFDSLHRHLHLGEPGRLYSELAASWLWVLALGGLVLWWRRQRGARRLRRMLRPGLAAAKGVRRTRGWHASTGLWLLLGLLILSATGLTWSTYAGARFDLLQGGLDAHSLTPDTGLGSGAASGGGHHEGAGTASADVDVSRVDTVVAVGRDHGLDGPLEVTPAGAGEAWTVAQADNVWPVRRDAVAVDPVAGAVTDHVRWADQPALAKLSALGIQAHMAVLFGPVNQVVLAAIAIGVLAMIFWGYRMWWQRRPTRADRRRPMGTPPARGGWRQLPVALIVIGVPAVVLVGLAMPMLGWSLLGFLVIDGLVGLVTRVRTARAGGGP
jgi:uncharacterized iron-regulated membrane protein